jgi:glutamate-ammonia-ligase adenylyltransferase
MDLAQKAKIDAAVEALPVQLRDIASRWFDRLTSEKPLDRLDDRLIPQLARLVACSDFAATTLLREWQWFTDTQNDIGNVPDAKELERFVTRIKRGDHAVEVVKTRLRRVRHRYLVQVLWREISGGATLDETVAALSHLADRLLDAAAGVASRLLRERYGVIHDADGNPVPIVILGMGKLGGNELNFSSDIDLIFLFPFPGDSDGAKSLSAQEYFTRLSRHIVALLDEVTADGFAFRIDTRLRPFGDSGPPVAGFAALESYLLQHGRSWERYAYVKARIVGPQPARMVADALQEELVRPFVYRRYLDFGVFESLREMHGLITGEVQRREMADNIKLGPGGIREIEFIVQSLQLVRGGSRPDLQRRGLLRVLPKLVGQDGMTRTDADTLIVRDCAWQWDIRIGTRYLGISNVTGATSRDSSKPSLFAAKAMTRTRVFDGACPICGRAMQRRMHGLSCLPKSVSGKQRTSRSALWRSRKRQVPSRSIRSRGGVCDSSCRSCCCWSRKASSR